VIARAWNPGDFAILERVLQRRERVWHTVVSGRAVPLHARTIGHRELTEPPTTPCA
jgi:hypothetical protein